MTKNIPLPPQSELKEKLSYDPETGVLKWSDAHAMSGMLAFACIRPDGYKRGHYKGRSYLAHRIIWKLKTGDDPDVVDHINGNPTDNRWCNLRSVKHAENSKNSRRSKRNQSGYAGVYKRPDRGGWMASICVDGRLKHLGYFKTKLGAICARRKAEKQYGYHENHGRVPAISQAEAWAAGVDQEEAAE